MKKKLLKSIVLVLVFIGAILFFEMKTSQVNEDLTSQMADATLPIIRFDLSGNLVGELHGHTSEMDPAAMRDGIICTGEGESLTVCIGSRTAPIKEAAYQFRSLDGERLLAEGAIEGFTDDGDLLTAEFALPELLAFDTEYLLCITLKMEDCSADYFCRLFRSTRCHEVECLEFAREFHENTFLEEGADFLRPYMDPATGSNTTLNFVTLGSTLDQVMWGDFTGSVSGEPSVTYQEINGTFTGLTLSYLLTSVNESGENEYYNVREFYRLRYTEDRMYVLNFERTMNQIFRQENSFLTSSDNILLGIRERDVECAATPEQDTVFFVQEGELWGYDLTANTLTDIFSFRGGEGIDARSNYDRHDIRILKVDENKNVDFAVYGYMNRGEHEGETALIVYRYTSSMHTIEELFYIPYRVSYEIMKQDVERLLYQNDNGRIYLCSGDSLFCIDPDTREVTVAAKQLSSDSCRISYDMRFIAWVPDDEPETSREIRFLDLEKEENMSITEADYDYVQPIAFMDGDFIYGAAKKEDLVTDRLGLTECPLSALAILEIREDGLHKIKNYMPSGCKIGSITVDSFTLHLDLVQKQGDGLVSVGSDAIVNREAQETQRVEVTTFQEGTKQRVVQITTGGKPGKAKLRVFSADVISSENKEPLAFPEVNRAKLCYIYAKGTLCSAGDNLSDMIREADEQVGIIADCSQKPLWKRAKKNYVNPFTDLGPAEEDAEDHALRNCLSTMILHGGVYRAVGDRLEKGSTPQEILQETFPSWHVLCLQGISVEEALYYVSAQSPVLAMTDRDHAVLLVGYTAAEVYYYDPADGKTHTLSYGDMNELLLRGDQKYITYLE